MPTPSKKTPEVIDAICNHLRQGDSRAEACRKVNIDDRTLRRWMSDEPSLSGVIVCAEKEYEDWYQRDILASAKRSLKQLVEGYDIEETITEYVPGKNGEPAIKRQTTKTKHIGPDASTVQYILNNRDPENWKNSSHQSIEGKVQTEAKQDVNLANIPDDLLEQVIKAINGEQ